MAGAVRGLFRRQQLVRDAVKGISFSIGRGEVVGFLGPNGAGKTTTLKMLSGILHPSAGEVRVLGHVPWARKKDFRMRVSVVMGQRSQLWPDLPAVETFNLNRAIYEIDRRDYDVRLAELVALFGVEKLLRVQVRRLSLGERMKMELIAALLHQPEVLFLDEPTIGLDLPSQQAIRSLIRTLNARQGTTVMLTSHYLSDIEDLCKRVILIKGGALVYDGGLGGVNGVLSARKLVKLIFSRPVPNRLLETYGGLRHVEGCEATFDLERAAVREFSRRALAELPVEDLTIEEIPLEEGLTRLYGGDPGRALRAP